MEDSKPTLKEFVLQENHLVMGGFVLFTFIVGSGLLALIGAI